MLNNSSSSYGLVAQLIHWATALLVLTLIPLGLYMHDLPADTAAQAIDKSWFYSLHKTLGVSVLFLALVRIAWALVQPHPRPLHGNRRLENLAAQTVHWTLYGAIVVMPLSGWLHHSALDGFAPIWWPLPQDLPLVPKSLQLASLFGSLHFFTLILLGICLVLHIGGALKHQFIDHDATLARMIPFGRVKVSDGLPVPQGRALAPVLALLAFLAVGAATLIGLAANRGDATATTPVAGNAGAGEAIWQVDRRASRLGIQIIQSGSPVEGEFTDWQAIIAFDPDDLASARVVVEIATASLTIGAVTQQALTSGFLNVAQYPLARYEAEKFVATGEGRYEADGLLQLAGHDRPVTLPFTLEIVDERAFVQGATTLDRLEFNIGRDGFSDDKMLGFQVDVVLTLEAEQPPTQ